ncbi:7490_t:CDS:2 [Ambispora leptoticha]|uniref:7490_t:CDS:1 n=1 Tax=Ambispora leptoticha TaxID=144679 RepID=A0A9N9FA77_9GLOM|nr:7490_t:CDS:2 [Ambispora leptoticha]
MVFTDYIISMHFSSEKDIPYSSVTNLLKENLKFLGQINAWCEAYANLVVQAISSQGAYTLPRGDILGPDTAVFLITRFLNIIKYKDSLHFASILCFIIKWNALSDNDKRQEFPPVAPNFVVELCSMTSSPQYIHRKMLLWIGAGVEGSRLEEISIDQIANSPTVRIYRYDTNTNNVVRQEFVNPQ